MRVGRVDKHIAVVTLDRPEKLNALDMAAFRGMRDAALKLRDDARLVDLELRLLGTDRCHSKTANFTHQLHLLNARQDPLSIAINRPYPRRLTAQWSNQAFSSAFRVALNLNARQLAKVTRARRLSFVLSEKLFGDAEQASPNPKPKP